MMDDQKQPEGTPMGGEANPAAAPGAAPMPDQTPGAAPADETPAA